MVYEAIYGIGSGERAGLNESFKRDYDSIVVCGEGVRHNDGSPL